MFEGRSPPDKVVLTTFVGGMRAPDLARRSDEEVLCMVEQELQDLVGTSGSAAFLAVARWERAIPQYTLGHLDRIASAEAAEKVAPGLFLCGAYRGGVAVGECIRNALAVGDATLAFLAARARPVTA